MKNNIKYTTVLCYCFAACCNLQCCIANGNKARRGYD